jgi:FMN phosphatase YigB (HAD superfamily)
VFDAVLFDLDGTLLDIDVDSFLRDYFGALGPVLAQVTGSADQRSALMALRDATDVMCDAHGQLTNQEVFETEFERLTGADLAEPEHAAAIVRFYTETFPSLQKGHGPRSGGLRAVAAARAAGAQVVVATNPIFPRIAIDERMRWAGLDQSWFDHVTSYERSTAAKPRAQYFDEIAALLGVATSRCLFVGDDAAMDLRSAAVGMKTFYVGRETNTSADWSGDLHDVAQFLEAPAL